MRSRWLAASSFGALLFGAAPALAAGCTLTGNAPTVTANVIAFGNYSAASVSDKTMNGSVQIRCPLGVGLLPNFSVALSAGNGLSGFSPRQMVSGGNYLNYNIYTTSGFGTVWGDGTGSTQVQTFTSILALGTITFTTFGKIPTGQYVPAATYNDTITVTVTY